MSGNPILAKLNSLIHGSNGNSFGDLTKSIDSLVNVDNLKRKTRISIDEVNILIEIGAVTRYLQEHNVEYDENGKLILDEDTKAPIAYTNAILEGMAEDMIDYLISLEGASRMELIEMFKNVREEVNRQEEAKT